MNDNNVSYAEEIKAIYRDLKVLAHFHSKTRIVLLVASLIPLGLLEVMSAVIFLPFISQITNPLSPEPRVKAMLSETFFEFWESSPVIYLGAAVLLAYLLKNIVSIMLQSLQASWLAGAKERFNFVFISSYLKAPFEYFSLKQSSDIARTVMQEQFQVYDALIYAVLTFLAETFVLLLFISLLFLLEPTATSLILGISIASGIAYTLLFRQHIRDLGKSFQESGFALQRIVIQLVQGLKELKLYQVENFYLGKTREVFQRQARSVSQLRVKSEIPRNLAEVLATLSALLLSLLFIYRGENPSEFIPKIGIFAVAAFRILPACFRILQAYTVILFSKNSLALIAGEIKTLETLPQETSSKSHQNLGEFKSLQCKNLGFRFATKTEFTIRNIEFEIRKGERLAIQGPSGSGKSTLLNLIMGLYKPTEGNIFVNDLEIGSVLQNWQRKVSLVPQSIYVFHGSLRENIAISGDLETGSDDKIWQALKMARLDDYVSSLEQGLDTPAGERGITLSGGELQRLGITRSLYRNPDLLVLDESTANLDPETESKILENLFLIDGLTILVITHNGEVAKRCDRIIRLDPN